MSNTVKSKLFAPIIEKYLKEHFGYARVIVRTNATEEYAEGDYRIYVYDRHHLISQKFLDEKIDKFIPEFTIKWDCDGWVYEIRRDYGGNNNEPSSSDMLTSESDYHTPIIAFMELMQALFKDSLVDVCTDYYGKETQEQEQLK